MLSNEKWYHISLVIENSKIKVYLDSELIYDFPIVNVDI